MTFCLLTCTRPRSRNITRVHHSVPILLCVDSSLIKTQHVLFLTPRSCRQLHGRKTSDTCVDQHLLLPDSLHPLGLRASILAQAHAMQPHSTCP